MYVQATFFPFPDQELDGPDPSDSPGCSIPQPPSPADPHGKAEFLATVAPLVTRIARSQHYRHGGRGGAAALEDLQADALGLAWLRWLRSADHTVSAPAMQSYPRCAADRYAVERAAVRLTGAAGGNKESDGRIFTIATTPQVIPSLPSSARSTSTLG